MVAISEFFLYLCFTFVMGTVLFYAIPENKRPSVVVPRRLLLAAAALIPFFSFASVLDVIITLGQDIGYGTTLFYVLFSFEIGKAWLIITVVGTLLFCLIYFNPLQKDRILAKMAVLLVSVLIFALGWGSHAASLAPFRGFIAHSFHFLAITVWSGLLLVAAFFSQKNTVGRAFLNWFSPLAFGCLALLVACGLLLTDIIVTDGYVRSWLIPYGQALLIKHLLFLPLLAFAFLNGFLLKKKDAVIRKWLQAEAVFVLAVFAVTGYMGQQAPPHDVETTLAQTGKAPWLKPFHAISWPVHLTFGGFSFLFWALALIFLFLLLYGAYKKTAFLFPVAMGALAVVSAYIGLMAAIVR